VPRSARRDGKLPQGPKAPRLVPEREVGRIGRSRSDFPVSVVLENQHASEAAAPGPAAKTAFPGQQHEGHGASRRPATSRGLKGPIARGPRAARSRKPIQRAILIGGSSRAGNPKGPPNRQGQGPSCTALAKRSAQLAPEKADGGGSCADVHPGVGAAAPGAASIGQGEAGKSRAACTWGGWSGGKKARGGTDQRANPQRAGPV